ncbi:glutathione-regulated potassium-efflux system protein KefC [Nocardia otitidiscaviarum]|uniref:Glutathione-regulated potassium-efflux system protein KefC n=1 Tax=Nocardia otitidiscaviarum TaxID=1823 RepID=A0A379JLB8_9NOCA|nr:cation:proton antiporter [Nocardia otitidiscaviarum]SUD48783.1 glutathione-regulated potassium-efflux system protein KefC [Nocardia otitidiscaviarum]
MSVLAAAADPTRSAILSLLQIALVTVLATVLARLARGYVPDVVLLLGFGVLIGPHVLDWAGTAGGVDLVAQLGLGMLFLLAGYELDPQLLRGRSGPAAWLTWVASLVLATLVVTLAAPEVGFTAHVAVAIAMTSTALGTLLPILKQAGMLDSALGRAVLRHGAVGELGPILAMSLLLSSRNPLAAVVVLVLFAIAAALVAAVPRRLLARIPDLRGLLVELGGGTVQLPVRTVLLLLFTLMAIAEVFDLDVVLGAFAAGMILRTLVREADPRLENQLNTLGFGFLIPVFFVVSGMGIDPAAIAGNPLHWALFVVSIAVARGGPVWLAERWFDHGGNLTSGRERAQLALYSATGLPIIVAVTEVATAADLMDDELASLLVAAGAATVLLFPLAARMVGRRPVATD